MVLNPRDIIDPPSPSRASQSWRSYRRVHSQRDDVARDLECRIAFQFGGRRGCAALTAMLRAQKLNHPGLNFEGGLIFYGGWGKHFPGFYISGMFI